MLDGHGRRLVLKWTMGAEALARFQQAQVITERLRTRGYPAPRYLYLGLSDGVSYAVQELLPGTPRHTLRPELLPRLLELNALQAEAAPEPAGDWPGEIVDSILRGCEGYCVLDSLRTYSTETNELLTALQALAAAAAEPRGPSSDIVHYDFTPANILVNGDVVSGVIDWDGARAGDRAFDLATLLFYTADPDLQAALWTTAVAQSSPEAVLLYLAHMIVRQVDWSIRHHDAAVVARWLDVSQALVQRFHVTKR